MRKKKITHTRNLHILQKIIIYQSVGCEILNKMLNNAKLLKMFNKCILFVSIRRELFFLIYPEIYNPIVVVIQYNILKIFILHFSKIN